MFTPTEMIVQQGTILEMMEDIHAALHWVALNVAQYHGDPAAMFIVGQSAGAQLSALALLLQASFVFALLAEMETNITNLRILLLIAGGLSHWPQHGVGVPVIILGFGQH